MTFNQTVLVCGAGGLGNTVAMGLASAGVGKLVLIDGDVVEERNLTRQWVYDKSDIGEKKVQCLARRIKARFPQVDITVIDNYLVRSNIIHWLSKSDLLIDCTDQPGFRLLADDAASITGKSWIYGGLSGSAFMTAVLNPSQGKGYRQLFPNQDSQSQCTPESTLGATVQMAGAMQALLAIETLKNNDLTGQLRVWNHSNFTMELFYFAAGNISRADLLEHYPQCFPNSITNSDWNLAEKNRAENAAQILALDYPGEKLSAWKGEIIDNMDLFEPKFPFYIYCFSGKKASALSFKYKKNPLFLGILHE